MKRLTIDRRRWLRGNDSDSYLLRDKDEKMCCLGFLAIKCGYTQNDIGNIGCPSSVDNKTKFPRSIVRGGEDTKTCNKLMNINDDDKLEDSVRETKLKSLFKRIGIQVSFRD